MRIQAMKLNKMRKLTGINWVINTKKNNQMNLQTQIKKVIVYFVKMVQNLKIQTTNQLLMDINSKIQTIVKLVKINMKNTIFNLVKFNQI